MSSVLNLDVAHRYGLTSLLSRPVPARISQKQRSLVIIVDDGEGLTVAQMGDILTQNAHTG